MFENQISSSIFITKQTSNVWFACQGIVRALKEYHSKLKETNVSIFVRRGGPNYQEGLRIMREVGKSKSSSQRLFSSTF